jgi:polyphosphate kinase
MVHEAAGPTPTEGAPQVEMGPERFLNRELSWLAFSERILELVRDPGTKPLERCRFLSIWSSGMDEFFQVRVAGLADQRLAGVASTSADGLSPAVQLVRVRKEVERLVQVVESLFSDLIVPELARSGVELARVGTASAEERAELVSFFERHVFPVLTPLAVDPGHPFPYISNLSLNLGVTVTDPKRGSSRFARVKIPPVLPRLVALAEGRRWFFLEEIIAANLAALFPEMELGECYCFRVTRNADLMLSEGEADDLLAAVEMELRRRRFGSAVRLEVESAMPEEMVSLLVDELELDVDDVYRVRVPMGLDDLEELVGIDRPDLKEPLWAPMTPPRLANAADEPADLFAALSRGEVLVHHPYDSFSTSVEALLSQAAADPAVLAIKQTLYRTSGDSAVIRSLIQAAEAGKQVAVLVELKARFDEQANIAWARALEEAGVHVVYGLVGLKTHAKVILIVREEAGGIRLYSHVGTGNYNSRTARAYEDLGLLSADPELGADLAELFNFLTGYSRPAGFRRLVMAPSELRRRVVEWIDAEAALGSAGRVVMKLNNLTDPAVIDALYRASLAGVPVDLIVRGICCLRPGVPGLSEHIRVRSVVGRFLEHSRILAFGGAGAERRLYIGSADMMERNLDRRVEVMVPVVQPDLVARLEEILDLAFADDEGAFELEADGTWRRVPTVAGISMQRALADEAVARARRRRKPKLAPASDGVEPR